MLKTKCYSVRLQSLISISDKCYKAVSFDGSEDLIPKSQVFGQDYSVKKSEAYFISAWILSKKNIQYSTKKCVFVNDCGNISPSCEIKTHIPKKKEPVKNKIDELTR